MLTDCSFDTTKTKLDYFRDKNCMRNFCLELTKHSKEIINYEKNEMIASTKKEQKTHNKHKICHVCKKRFSTDDNNKKYHKVRDHCHYTGKYGGSAHDI